MGVGLGYSIFDEYHRSWVPGRTTTILDIGLDIVGLGSALLILWFVETKEG